MTQQFGELEAGRELDHVVADIVGWEQLSPVHEPPEFSVSHEAAACVKQFLRDQGREFIVYHTPEHVAVEWGWLDEHHFGTVEAESEPLALCRFLARLDNEGVLNNE